MKAFLFLYPEKRHFKGDISSWEEYWHMYADKPRETFRTEYTRLLNLCVDLRYRRKGFDIFYALFDDTEVDSSVIQLQSTDKIIKVGMDSKTYKTNGTYPDNDFILDQLGEVNVLRLGGFHIGDCVDRVARRAHKKGIETLIDEDLTNLFGGSMFFQDFKPDTPSTPSIFAFMKENSPVLFRRVKSMRQKKPWLTQFS